MSENHILVVDDEPDIRALVKDILEDEGYQVTTAKDASDARKHIKAALPSLVLLDIWMPNEDGISLLKECKRNFNNKFPIVMMSGHGTIETAVESTRLGAAAFLEKPLTTAKLLKAVKHMLPNTPASTVRTFAGSSEIAVRLREQAENLAKSDNPLFIYGETGTGKGNFAEYIHLLSKREQQNLVTLTPTSTVADLSAYIANGFGGDDTTLLLRDIATMSMQEQKAIAEMLSKKTTGRVIATGDRNPAQLERDGTLIKPLARIFEQEVLYIPPLREHIEDILELLNTCIDYNCANKMLNYRGFSIPAQNYLRHHAWPGNMKELDDLVVYLLQQNKEEAVSANEARLALKKIRSSDTHLDLLLQKPLREARDAFERIYLEQLLRVVGGNISKLASRAGIERTHLYRKLKSLGINTGIRKKNQ